MVYKIRNKSFFYTISGTKNNYCPKVLNTPVDVKSESTFAIKSYDGGPEFIRFHQLYRNLSRKLRQFLYGNKKAEEHVLLILREHFKLPFNCETPIHLIQNEPLRRFLNQGDRDYELISHNTHPYQMRLYRDLNENVQKEEENKKIKEEGLPTIEEEVAEEFSERVKEVQSKFDNKAPLNVLDQIMRESYRNYLNKLGVEKSRNSKGDFNDYLEKGRNPDNSEFLNKAVKSE